MVFCTSIMNGRITSHIATTVSPVVIVILAMKSMDHLMARGFTLLLLLARVDHSENGSRDQNINTGGKVQSAAWKQVLTRGTGTSQALDVFQKTTPVQPHSHSARTTKLEGLPSSRSPFSITKISKFCNERAMGAFQTVLQQ